jgi:hypothetical protein
MVARLPTSKTRPRCSLTPRPYRPRLAEAESRTLVPLRPPWPRRLQAALVIIRELHQRPRAGHRETPAHRSRERPPAWRVSVTEKPAVRGRSTVLAMPRASRPGPAEARSTELRARQAYRWRVTATDSDVKARRLPAPPRAERRICTAGDRPGWSWRKRTDRPVMAVPWSALGSTACS